MNPIGSFVRTCPPGPKTFTVRWVSSDEPDRKYPIPGPVVAEVGERNQPDDFFESVTFPGQLNDEAASFTLDFAKVGHYRVEVLVGPQRMPLAVVYLTVKTGMLPYSDAIQWDTLTVRSPSLPVQWSLATGSTTVTGGGLTQSEVEALIAASITAGLTPEQVAEIAASVGDLSNYPTNDEVADAIAAAVAGLGASGDVVFTADKPLTVNAPRVTAQANGEPIGFDADQTYQAPDIVGGIPVVVDGTEYLIPLIER